MPSIIFISFANLRIAMAVRLQIFPQKNVLETRGGQSYFTGTRGGQSYCTETRGGQSYFTGTRGWQSYFMRNRGGQSYFAGKDNFFSSAEVVQKSVLKS